MNKLPRPNIDDALALTNLANNRRAGSYPHLLPSLDDLKRAYLQYEAAAGNAFSVSPVAVSPTIESFLKSHFKTPPKDLEHIKKLRAEAEFLTCPMCGSSHRGTLDHLLPQASHGAFSVFSLNLVPACKCNSLRQEILIGPNPGERILHPYFDGCLERRLLKAKFEDLGPVPRVKLQLCVTNSHPDFAAIEFHMRSIVSRTPVTGYLRDRWAKFCRKPSLIIRALEKDPPSYNMLRRILLKELRALDDQHDGCNNWHSMFVAGLLDQTVLVWLYRRFHQPGRSEDTSLI